MKSKLTRETIDNIFKGSTHQSEVMLKLYKVAIPNYSKVKKIHNFPIVNNLTGAYLFTQFLNFDKKFHPSVIPGGRWLDSGFSTREDLNLDDFTVSINRSSIEYK